MSSDAEVEFPYGALRPPPRGFFAEDLDRLHGLPHDAELIDGSIVVPAHQVLGHECVVSLLQRALMEAAPHDKYHVRRRMSVILAPRRRLVPDLMVIHADQEIPMDGTYYPATAVLLAIEVVSPDTEIRDRVRKARIYAEAGIPHLWRVEGATDKPALFHFELDRERQAYTCTGVLHDRATLTAPFPVVIDFDKIGEF